VILVLTVKGHEGGDVSLNAQVVLKNTFHYLGLIPNKDGDIDKDVNHRIKARCDIIPNLSAKYHYRVNIFRSKGFAFNS
jgi:hypothetical protein